MTSDTDLFERSLRQAVSDVDIRDGFVDQVLKGGRRRRFRRRVGMITAATVFTAVIGGMAVSTPAWLATPDEFTPAVDSRMFSPTGGDLAGDTAFVARVSRTWTAEVGDHLNWNTGARGCWEITKWPHVFWAGNTRSGPAAVVMQTVRGLPGKDCDVPAGETSMVGLVGTDAYNFERFMVLSAEPPTRTHAASEVFVFGFSEETLLVLEESGARSFSASPVSLGDGKLDRVYEPLTFRDGVALAQVPHDSSNLVVVGEGKPGKRAALPRIRSAAYASYWANANAAERSTRAETEDRLEPSRGWNNETLTPDGHRAPRADRAKADRVATWLAALRTQGYGDPAMYTPGLIARRLDPLMSWRIDLSLPGNRFLLSSEVRAGAESHLYVVLGSSAAGAPAAEAVYGGRIDRNPVLPIRLRLPDGQWFVGRPGARISWTADGTTWSAIDGDAAVIPATATSLQVHGDRMKHSETVSLTD